MKRVLLARQGAGSKLRLRRETIVALTSRELALANGAAPRPTSAISCIKTACGGPPVESE